MMVAVDNYPLHQQHFWVVYAVNYYKRKEICAGLYILNWCYVLYYRLRRLSVHLITLNHRMYWTTLHYRIVARYEINAQGGRSPQF